MRLILVIAGYLLLPGCASTNDALAGQPDEVIRTAMPVAEVVRCFEQKNNMRVIERSDGARVAVFRNGYGGVANTFSIYPEGRGSRIERRHRFIGMPFIKWKRCVGLEQER